MSYDAGAVDLWRIFQLLRVFFTANRARVVIDGGRSMLISYERLGHRNEPCLDPSANL
jgi:hypothetical protein